MSGCKEEDDCQTPMWCRGKSVCPKVQSAHSELREIIKDNLDDVRRLTITKAQKSIIDFCCMEKTTAEVAQKYKISIQSASTRLKKLFDLGYLNRVERAPETGGIEYFIMLHNPLVRGGAARRCPAQQT